MKARAVILAAGFSTRMQGRFKPLLPLPLPTGEVSCLEAVIGLYGACDVPALVVCGHCGEQTAEVARRAGAQVAVNPDPAQGMFSSVQAGFSALPEDGSPVFVHPVDIPLVGQATVRALLAAAAQGHDAVTVPAFRGRNGHPPLIPASARAGILAWDGGRGLAGALAGLARQVVEVDDPHILQDMDTPEAYAHVCRLAGQG